MNQDDIMRIAREACPYTTDEMRGAFYEGFLKGAVAEREACAKECDIQSAWGNDDERFGARQCAIAIRARGQV